MIETDIDHENPGFKFHVTIKDGCDGMGDVSGYKEKGDTSLPDKAFR